MESIYNGGATWRYGGPMIGGTVPTAKEVEELDVWLEGVGGIGGGVGVRSDEGIHNTP